MLRPRTLQGTARAALAAAIAAITAVLLPVPAFCREIPPPSGRIVGSEIIHTVLPGESLAGIAGRFGVDTRVLAVSNGLTPASRLAPGQPLRVDGRHLVPDLPEWGIVVNIPQRFLFYAEDGQPALAFPVAVGKRDWKSPVGAFRVATRERHPVWDVPVSIQAEMRRLGHPVVTKVPPGPDNPLGDYWMGLSESGCGIHATNVPASIYGFRTHGCIRLHPDDAGQLFDRVVVGLPVEIVYRRALLAGGDDGAIYVEIHPDPYLKTPDARGEVRALALEADLEGRIDWALVDLAISRKEGSPRRVDRPPPGASAASVSATPITK